MSMCAGHVIPHAIIIYQVTHHLMRIGHHARGTSEPANASPVEFFEHDLAPWLQQPFCLGIQSIFQCMGATFWTLAEAQPVTRSTISASRVNADKSVVSIDDRSVSLLPN
jgi:hypothetical protein